MGKTSILPLVRVSPAFRATAESVLSDGESLSQFVEASVRAEVHRRSERARFAELGIQALADYDQTGAGADADLVLDRLQGKLDAALETRRKAAA